MYLDQDSSLQLNYELLLELQSSTDEGTDEVLRENIIDNFNGHFSDF